MRKPAGDIRESFKSVCIGMLLIVLAIITFIVALRILIAIVRVIAGIG